MQKSEAIAASPHPIDCWPRKIRNWVSNRFGRNSLFDQRERAVRVLEEACELAQAAGLHRRDISRIATYVYRRPPGELRQEAAGIVVTLFALATAYKFDLIAETQMEIDRILRVPATVSRRKQTLKAIAGIARMPDASFRR